MSESKKVTYFASWEVKKCVDSFAEKKNSTLFGILRPFWIVLEDSLAGTFEIFSGCFAVFFFCFFFSWWNDACS